MNREKQVISKVKREIDTEQIIKRERERDKCVKARERIVYEILNFSHSFSCRYQAFNTVYLNSFRIIKKELLTFTKAGNIISSTHQLNT